LCPYFDSEYRWTRRIRIPLIETPHFPEENVHGGPRLRLLHPALRRHYDLVRAFWRLRDLLKLPVPERLRPSPSLIKIPFVHWLPGTRFLTSHVTTPLPLSKVTGIMLHFKFLDDFYERAAAELERKEHYQGASEHARLLHKLRDARSPSFCYPGSLAYEGSGQLLGLGLLREDEGWARVRTAAGETSDRPEPSAVIG
jgi:hypothetical protein